MDDTSINRSEELTRLLGTDRRTGRLGQFARWLAAAALIAFAILGYAWLRSDDNARSLRYRTEAMTHGNLVVTVSATCNLQPTNQVDVGSELSGTVEVAFVDDNDQVKRGQILARLDVSKLKDQVGKSEAAVVAAEAQVNQMRATVAEDRANLARLRQVAKLSGGKVPSKSEIQSAEAALQRAIASQASARASVTQARAALKSDQTNLDKASIRSPIDGVVLARQVEPGQTVAASLQAPVLFMLAENLAQMELKVNVDEADVGQVREGQSATFTVDAYPSRRYPARITRVGYGSQTKDGVVSYKTLLNIANDDLSLRPGMTATAEITTAARENVLLVPNAALRFVPPARAQVSDQGSGGLVAKLLPRPPRDTSPKLARTSAKGTQQVWVLHDGEPAPITVSVGATDGRMTEVTGAELRPGMQVVTESLDSPQ